MFAEMLDLEHPLYWTVDDVLTPAECAGLIAKIDAAGPEAAPVTTAAGPLMRPDVRNNTRVMFDAVSFAKVLFDRIASHVPKQLKLGARYDRRFGDIPQPSVAACGVNERLRCYRYEPGQRFGPHYDGAFVRSKDERSYLTLLIYLNEGYQGGRTRFLELDREIEPRVGRALFFQHAILHEGAVVEEGVKYALRSDVMYRICL